MNCPRIPPRRRGPGSRRLFFPSPREPGRYPSRRKRDRGHHSSPADAPRHIDGLEISQQIGLPFPVTEKLLHALKTERLLVFKSVATLSDYVYEITDAGLQRARQSAVDCTYCGTVPVALGDYVAVLPRSRSAA